MILAADIGPTTAHVALFDQSGYRLIRVETFRTLEHDGVAGLLQSFLGSLPVARLDVACVGVTVDWTAYAHELAEVFEIPLVVVVDGLEAHVHHLRDLARLGAEGLAALADEGLATVPDPRQKVVSSA
jgi:pantothenate kinase type III